MKGLGGHLHVLSLFFRGHLLNIPNSIQIIEV